ncbi:MAG: PKD domain-containing protein [Verrucomicrobiota bacterium]
MTIIVKEHRLPLIALVMMLLLGGARAAQINVPEDHPTIQQAINAASNGDEVVVSPGNYPESITLTKNITVRSIDPTNQNVTATTVINDGGHIGSGSTVMIGASMTSSCVLQGFTVTGGYITGSGAGISGNGSSATIRFNRIIGNKAFLNPGASGGGGGITSLHGTIEYNQISNNIVEGGGVAEGGAIRNCNGIIRNNVICSNQANPDIASGASGGGGLAGCNGIIRNNVIYGNGAGLGGGLESCSGTIENNLVCNNSAGDGGGIYGCNGTIRNNTIYGNIGGGVRSCNSVLTNCIIWANGAGSQVDNNTPYPAYSCIQNWNGFGVGNISSDPKFLNAGNSAGVDRVFGTADDGFHLLIGSPCIDMGASLAALTNDLSGLARPQGVGIDMGAYEGSVPKVNAGTNLTLILPAAAILDGAAISSNALVTTWSKISGPGIVVFGNPNSTNTTATFSMAGAYVLRLTASDGVLSASDETTVSAIECTYNLSENSRTIGARGYTNSFLVAVIDSCPWTAAAPSDTWILILSGSSAVGSGAVNYAASPNANSGGRTGTITVADQTFALTQDGNAAPQVTIAPVAPVTLPTAIVNLDATVTDDGAPFGTVSTTWSKITGPGTVDFGNVTAIDTTATFSTNGSYVLRLTASDGVSSGSNDVVVFATMPSTVINPLTTVGGHPVVLPREAVAFSSGATDSGGNPLSCLWDFGDGQTSVDCEPSHVFSNCGPLEVTAIVSDGVTPVTNSLLVSVACPFSELPKPVSLKMKSNFAPGKLDTAALKTSVDLPVGFSAPNTPVTLELAGVEIPFTLNAKGQAVNVFSSIKFSHKGTGTLWQVSAKLKGDFDAAWQNAGLTNATVTALPITVPVLFLFDISSPESFYMEKPLLYKATAGKSGTGQ